MLQPVLFDYRRHVIDGISARVPVHLITELRCPHPNCSFKNLSPHRILEWPFEVLSALILLPGSKTIFIPAYTTHLGIVLSALIAWLSGIPIIVHGQALFKKPNASLVDFCISLFWLLIARRYIAYSAIGIEGPFAWPFSRRKTVVIPNRFESIDSLGLSHYTPLFDSFIGEPSSLRLLFIGRDRPGSRLDLIISAVRCLSRQGLRIHLDIVGFSLASDEHVTYHGPLFGSQIIEIASFVHVGVYPGSAGLSILHYMALGLCPLVHGDIRSHSGPEPSYIEDGFSGAFFVKDSLDSLVAVLLKLYSDPAFLSALRCNAFKQAQLLHSKLYSTEIYSVTNQSQKYSGAR